MAAATSVKVQNNQRSQFQGVFSNTWVVEFTIDTASVSANGIVEDTIAVPGVEAGDMVLGIGYFAEPDHELVRWAYVPANDVVHFVTHNGSGGAVNPPSSVFKIVIARPVSNA